ncbi:hypothetical protein I8R02_27085, partial [Klebsiella pneumoniae]|nr:hypothetical protein [Klebsiella pneumoniae]
MPSILARLSVCIILSLFMVSCSGSFDKTIDYQEEKKRKGEGERGRGEKRGERRGGREGERKKGEEKKEGKRGGGKRRRRRKEQSVRAESGGSHLAHLLRLQRMV